MMVFIAISFFLHCDNEDSNGNGDDPQMMDPNGNENDGTFEQVCAIKGTSSALISQKCYETNTGEVNFGADGRPEETEFARLCRLRVNNVYATGSTCESVDSDDDDYSFNKKCEDQTFDLDSKRTGDQRRFMGNIHLGVAELDCP